MREKRSWLSFLAVVLCGWGHGSSLPADDSPTRRNTALDEYVAKPDNTFAWKRIHKSTADGMTTYVVDLTSQNWRDANEVNRTEWQHWLVISRPEKTAAKKALLFIGGGRNGREPPQSGNDRSRLIAKATNSVVIELGTIPNQPLEFHGDGKPRFEDDLIAYAWDQYLKTGDPTWLPRLPMVKSVVRAMDAIQTLLSSDAEGGLDIERFVVAGGSKRGWTTWMTAAVDPRVCAIIPIVIDVLNVNKSMNHHYAAYGFWAPAIGDYVHHRITHRRNTPEYARLLGLVDPYAYRTRFTMPKCIVNATGDEFFLPDSSRFYFDELPGEKHLCYVPNSNHSLRDTDALDTLLSFYDAIVHDRPRPEFSWKFEGSNTIRVHSKTAPQRVLLWSATNPAARDFRIKTIGRGYRSRLIKANAEGQYVARVAKPAKGWTAYFVQLEFDVGAPAMMRLTTPVRVIPDVLPHADKKAPEGG